MMLQVTDLFDYPAYVLRDTGASHTFISERFALMHALSVESLLTVVFVSFPLGKDLVSVISVRSCILQ